MAKGEQSAANRTRILQLSDSLDQGQWTTYGAIGEVVYGPGRGAQHVGSVMRNHGHEHSAHRVLKAGGKISPLWRSDGGGPEVCRRRLRCDGVWDESRNRARPEGELNAEGLRRLEQEESGA